MVLTAAVFLSAMTPVQYLMDLQGEKQAKVERDEIVIRMSSVKGQAKIAELYTIYRLGGEKFAIDLSEPGLPLRRHIFDSKSIMVYEPSTKKFTLAKVAKGDNIAAVIDENLPNLDLFPKLLMLQDGSKDFAGIVKATPGWTWVSGKPMIKINTKGVKGSLELDRRTNRISKFVTTLQGVTTTWTMSYKPLASDSVFRVGSEGYQVAVLTDPGKMPKIDAGSRVAVDRMLRLYEPPKAVAFKVKGNGGWTTAQYTRRGIRQSNDTATVVYDGRNMIVESRGQKYGGVADNESLLDAVAKVGSRLEPFLRDLTSGANPLRKLLEGTSTVKAMGTAKVAGEDCDVLQAKGRDYTLTLFVSRKDGFVLRINTSLPGQFQYSDSKEFARTKLATEKDVSAANLSDARPLSQLLD